ncbi:MMPL family transporter [Sulfobacillus sp. hq2]|uniref:MMPL family transporter n=2 Tax=Sulfobacillus TaxID=28033 RepID=UPI000CD01197|nr:MMPL family transporter [Sulfobacillus sp. hq2]POB10532.1 hypothetical protein CO251_09485 [Sulfobacillus sp. hq2]
MHAGWTRFTVRSRWLVIMVWVLLIVATIPLAMQVTRHLTANGFDNPRSEARWATDQLSRLNPPPAPDPLLIQGLSQGRVIAIAQDAHIGRQTLHPLHGGGVLYVPSPQTSVSMSRHFETVITAHHGQWQDVTQGSVGKTVAHDSAKTLALSGVLAIPFLAVLLFAVFGSVAAIALPLIIAVAGSEIALSVITLVETHIQLSVFLTDIVSFLALGVGIDYALFISTRFRQALDRGHGVEEAVVESMRHAGRSVLYSGIAVALAVATLLLGGNAYWQGLALGGAVAIASVLLATHSLLPAVMAVMGKHLRWGGLKRVPNWGFWRFVGRLSVDKPWWGLILSVLLLVPLALLGPRMQMRTPANLASMLPLNSPIRQAVILEQKIQGPGSIAPLGVVMRFATPLSQAQTWSAVNDVTAHLQNLSGVKKVSSPRDLGVPPGGLAAMVGHKLPEPAALKTALSNFINPHVIPRTVVVYVVATTGPDNPATAHLAARIDHQLPRWLPRGTRAAVGGQVPILRSFNTLTAHRLPWIIGAALIVALIVLSIATGSIMQAVLGVVFDALVALATAGLLVLVVQRGLWGFQAQPLDSSITPLIFVLLFGLSMDYEVILLHRIQEPLRTGAPVSRAVYSGVSTTGSMITGAGMIMVVVFLSLMVSPLQVMKTLALGLSFAVLVDTWIVRSLLVPSTIVLLGRASYWPWRIPSSDPAQQVASESDGWAREDARDPS